MLVGIVALVVVCGVAGVVWLNKAMEECQRFYVTNRPDLSRGCGANGESCTVTVSAYTFRYLPTQKTRGVKVALFQDCLSPSPDAMLAQFTLTLPDMRLYLSDKRPLDKSIEQALKTYGPQFERERYRQLEWWPPRQTPSTRAYTAHSPLNGFDYFVFADEKSGLVTLMIPAPGRN